jgi:UDP-GlcNAc:undecaprenyl-phosphate GlcNAc-1-phosphate transferase
VHPLLTFIIAMVATMAMIPPAMRLAVRWRIVDMPAARKVHTTVIPRVGGIAMAIGLLLAALLSVEMSSSVNAYLLAAVTLLVFGVLDDRLDLDYRIKFAGQLLGVAIVIFGGQVRIDALTLNERVLLPAWLGLPLSAFFLLGITNAINLADGLDGLAGGMAFLCLGALGLLAHGGGLVGPMGLAMAGAGAVFGFLRYNTYPARVFMGDAGSQLLGFTVGVLGIMITQNPASAVSTALPVLLVGIPILDTLSVMVQRLGEGRSPFSADRNHLHHRLLALGFDHREAVTTIYIGQAVLFVAAYLFRYESDLLIVGAYLGFCAAVIVLMQWATRNGWQLRHLSRQEKVGWLSRWVDVFRQPHALPLWSVRLIGGGLFAYAVLVLSHSADAGRDFRWLAFGLLIASLAGCIAWRSKPVVMAERGILYVFTAVVVYLDTTVGPPQQPWTALHWALPLGIAAMTALRLRLSADRRFELTPLDLLVLFVALVVPNLPGLVELPPGTPLGIAKIVVLCYAIELLAGSLEVRAAWVRACGLVLQAAMILWALSA